MARVPDNNADASPRRAFVGACIAVAICIAALLVVTPRYDPDSAHYVDTAAQLAAGNGPRCFQLTLDAKTVPAPFGTWPYLYPILLSAFLALGLHHSIAVSVVNAICLTLIAIIVYGMSRELKMAPHWGLLAVLLALAHPFYRLVIYYAWSEPLFIVFLYLSFLLALKAFRERPGYAWLVAGGVCAGAAFATRYIALYLVIYVSAGLVLYGWRKWGRRRALLGVVAWVVPAFLAMVPTVMVNLRYFGSPFGWDRLKPESHLIFFARQVQNILETFESELLSGVPIWLVTLYVVCHLWRRDDRHGLERDRAPTDRDLVWRAWFVFGWAVFYAGALLLLAVADGIFAAIEARYLSPCVPALAVAASFALSGMLPGLSERSSRRLRLTMAAACLMVGGAYADTSIMLLRNQSQVERPYFSPLSEWAESRVGPHTLFVGSKTWWMTFCTGAIVLEDGYLESENLTPQSVAGFLNSVGRRFEEVYLIFQPSAVTDYPHFKTEMYPDAMDSFLQQFPSSEWKVGPREPVGTDGTLTIRLLRR